MMKPLFSIILATLICRSTLATDPQSLGTRQTNIPTVNTTSGIVSGHASSNASTGVFEYLGIPFAKPPVGDLRFAPPVKYLGTASINGTRFGFSCPTLAAYQSQSEPLNIAGANLTTAGLAVLTALGDAGVLFSEDCLTLNVWVPGGGEAKKAVLVWIHGGGFTGGTSNTTVYNGQYIASQEDVIVVSINYRLNIFGFPGNPAVPDLNLGLLDQRLAIEWVQENIPAFGGDASRITIFGQSAGSASVDYYSYAYVSDPIVAGMIQESGSINGFGSVPRSAANDAWFNVTSILGCGSSTSNATDVLTCMRTKSPSDIINAIPLQKAGSITGGLGSFGPAVDDLTVFSDYPARSAAGNFIKAPLLIGNADYEAGLFATDTALANVTYPTTFWTEFDLIIFTCPAAERANISITSGVPTWRYRWFGDFPNLRLTSIPDSGAWHASELPVLFGNFPTGTGIPASTEAELSIGDYMRGAWAAFAKDPVNGLNSYEGGWPKYSPLSNTLVRLAYNNVTGTNLAMPGLYDGPCRTQFAYNATGNGTASVTTSATGAATLSSSSTSPSTSSQSSGSKVSSSSVFLTALLGLMCVL